MTDSNNLSRSIETHLPEEQTKHPHTPSSVNDPHELPATGHSRRVGAGAGEGGARPSQPLALASEEPEHRQRKRLDDGGELLKAYRLVRAVGHPDVAGAEHHRGGAADVDEEPRVRRVCHSLVDGFDACHVPVGLGHRCDDRVVDWHHR